MGNRIKKDEVHQDMDVDSVEKAGLVISNVRMIHDCQRNYLKLAFRVLEAGKASKALTGFGKSTFSERS